MSVQIGIETQTSFHRCGYFQCNHHSISAAVHVSVVRERQPLNSRPNSSNRAYVHTARRHSSDHCRSDTIRSNWEFLGGLEWQASMLLLFHTLAFLSHSSVVHVGRTREFYFQTMLHSRRCLSGLCVGVSASTRSCFDFDVHNAHLLPVSHAFLQHAVEYRTEINLAYGCGMRDLCVQVFLACLRNDVLQSCPSRHGSGIAFW